jgi:hypothetical protein
MWFKYDRDDLCVNKSQFVPVIFEPPLYLDPSGYYTYHQVYETLKIPRSAYTVYLPRMCFKWISEQRAIIFQFEH